MAVPNMTQSHGQGSGAITLDTNGMICHNDFPADDYLSSTTKYHDLSPASQLLNSVLCDTNSPPQSSFIARLSGTSTTASSSRCSANTTLNPSSNSICNDDNVEECLIFLNQELMVLGFPSILNRLNKNNNSSSSSGGLGSNNTVNLTQLINCAHELLQRLQKNIRMKDEMESRHSRVNSDMIFLQQTQVKLKDDLEQKQRDNALFQEKERQMLNKVKTLTNKLKVKEEELKKQLSAHQQRDAQFRHEIRKKERESTKLKERVHTFLTDKNRDKKMGMDLLNLIEKPEGSRRGTWKTTQSATKSQEDMYKSIISKYELRQKEVLYENSELRQSLRKMETQLLGLFNSAESDQYPDSNSTDSEEDTRSTHSSSSGVEITKAHYEMPYDVVRHDIEVGFQVKLRAFRDLVAKKRQRNEKSCDQSSSTCSSCQTSPVDKKFPDDELSKNENQKPSVAMSEQSCQTECTDNLEQSFLVDSHLLEEKEFLDKRKNIFDEQISNFEQERNRFTDAAVRLGHDRREFEIEKAEFLETACKHTSTIPKLNPPKSVNVSPNPKRLLFGTPTNRHIATPDCKVQPRTPSTVELYKFLGIYSNTNVSVDE